MQTFRSHLKKELENNSFAQAYNFERELLAIAMKVNEARNNYGLSQIQLANKAKITQQQLSKIENGENCNMLTLLRVIKALNLKI